MLLVINSPQSFMVKGPLIKANCRENGKAGPTANFNWESFSYLRNYKIFTRQWRGLVSTLEIWTSLVSQMERNLLAMQKMGFDSWVGKIPWRSQWWLSPVFLPGEFHGQRSLVGYNLWGSKVGHDWVTKPPPPYVYTGFPGSASGKGPAFQCRRLMSLGFKPWVRKIPWRRAWQLTPVFLPGRPHGQRSLVPEATKSQTRLSD